MKPWTIAEAEAAGKASLTETLSARPNACAAVDVAGGRSLAVAAAFCSFWSLAHLSGNFAATLSSSSM